jgi:cell division septum initiation protein DivIVA
MEEVRDTYRLESKSQTETISKLRTQLSTAENNLSSSAGDVVQLGQLRADLAKAQTTAKEEEEKRSKAISLLKTVRQKLVKVEKEKEEIEKDRAEERAQRSRAMDDVEKVKAEREREANKLRKSFERELASLKERSDKELAGKKGTWELEMITTKVRESINCNSLTLVGQPRKRAHGQGIAHHGPRGDCQGAARVERDPV